MSAVIAPGDLSGDFTPDEVGELLFLNMTGSTMTSDTHGLSPVGALNRQTLLWRALLAAAVPPGSLPRFQQLLTEAAQRYRDAAPDARTLHQVIRADIEKVPHKSGIDLDRFYRGIGI